MRPSVTAVFPAFTADFEGCTRYLYLDVKGLVTTGRGNLVDPMPAALALPWKRHDGSLASSTEVAEAWQTVKGAQWLCQHGGAAFATLTTLRLDPADVDALTLAKLRQNDAALAGRFPFWDDLPASAQLAVHSLAWACGPAFRFPLLEAALADRDWATCADECQMDETGNPGLRPRNAADRALFAACLDPGDPDTISGWP